MTLTLGNKASWLHIKNMQPLRIIFELDITDILFTGLMCIAVLFVLAWLIFLQEQINQWFDILDLDK